MICLNKRSLCYKKENSVDYYINDVYINKNTNGYYFDWFEFYYG